jgi:hypothetical protein
MPREGKMKGKKPKTKLMKKTIKKNNPKVVKSKKAMMEAAKIERRKERKELLKAKEKRKEAVEEEELKIEKELFDNQGYYPGPALEEVREVLTK